MRNFFPTLPLGRLLWLFGPAILATTNTAAQCPVGSIVNTAGNYNSGQRACITANFSGGITIRNGASLTVTSGGNYTGNLDARNGSSITVQSGGRLAPSNANNFAADITNDGIVVMNTISIENGASVSNNGHFTWQGNWNQHADVTVANTACGTMNFHVNTNLGNGADIQNNGRLNFQGGIDMTAGASINNRGALYVNGNINSAGLIYNQFKAIFRGGNNNLNSGDSIVNLGFMVFNGTVNSSRNVRNEGLLSVGGSFTVNSGTMLINNVNAQVRVNGTFTNNWFVEGNGNLYVNGALNNNFIMLGKSASERLRTNKAATGFAFLVSTNASMTAHDTTTYTAASANPAVCTQILPLHLTGLQGLYENGLATIRWTDQSSSAQTYYVEWSTDGQHFVTAGTVAAGQTGTIAHYRFSHAVGANGTLYYRIRQQDANGEVQYSRLLILQTGKSTTTQIFPNPFTDNLQVNVTLTKSSVIHVALYHSGGQLIKQEQQMGQAGRNSITLNGLTSLLPGIYVARITAGGNTIYSKLIK